jgi:hypothetical protein
MDSINDLDKCLRIGSSDTQCHLAASFAGAPVLAFAMASLVSTWFMALWPHPGKLMGTHFSKAWPPNGDPKFNSSSRLQQ